MPDIGFGVIGCGFAGTVHAEAITSARQGKLIAVCDIEEKKVREFVEKYRVDGYTDLKRFLSRDDIQIVSICTTSGLHARLGIEAAKAGKHLVIEKPLEISPARCDAVIDAAKSNRRKLTVIYPNRFKQAVKALRSALGQGRFGRLVLGNALVRWHRPPEYYVTSQWRGSKNYSGGGALMNQSIHAIDLLQWMMGPVKAVQSKVRTLIHRIEVEDTALAILEFESGALGLVEGTTSVYPGFDGRLEILGEDGSACIEGERIASWVFPKVTKR